MNNSDRKAIERIKTCSIEDFLSEIGLIVDKSTLYSSMKTDGNDKEKKDFLDSVTIARNINNVGELYDYIFEIYKKYLYLIDREAYLVEAAGLTDIRENIVIDDKSRAILFKIDPKQVQGKVRNNSKIQEENTRIERIARYAKHFVHVPCDAIEFDDNNMLIINKSKINDETAKHLRKTRSRIECSRSLYEEVVKGAYFPLLMESIQEENVRRGIYHALRLQYGESKEDKEIDLNTDEFAFKLIMNNLQYFDLDKVLLANLITKLDIARNKEDISFEEIEEIKDFKERVLREVKNKKTTIPAYSSDIDFEYIDSKLEYIYSHFICGEVLSDDEISTLKINLIYGTVPYDSVSPDGYKRVLKFSKNELDIIFMNDVNAIKFFLDNDIITTDSAREMLSIISAKRRSDLNNMYITIPDSEKKMVSNLEFSADSINELYERNIVNVENILQLYLNEYISEEVLDSIEAPIAKCFNVNTLVDLYDSRNGEADEERFKRFLDMYKRINLKEKTQEEINELSGQVLEALADKDFSEEKIYDLYHLGVVSCDVVLDYMGVAALRDLYASGELKSTDARRLYYDGIITDEMLKDVFSSDTLDDGKKISLIFRTFYTEEEEEKRNEFIKYISEVQQTGKKRKSTDSRDIKPDNIKKNSNKYMYDTCARWRLIYALDSEASDRYLQDGHEVIYLPNLDKYVIERLFEAGNAKKPAYGTATYILDGSFYRANESEIIATSKLQRSFLSESLKSGKTLRINHSKDWDIRMCKKFKIDTSPIYTEAERAEIRKRAKAVANSRKLFETANGDDKRS